MSRPLLKLRDARSLWILAVNLLQSRCIIVDLTMSPMSRNTAHSGMGNMSQNRLVFYYNSLLLPEYLSATLLSIVASIGSLWIPVFAYLDGNPTPWQLWPALGLYLTVAILLIFKTFQHRQNFSRLVISRDEMGTVWIDFPSGRIEQHNLRDCHESLCRFFGRRARQLVLVDDLGTTRTVTDGLYGYDLFRRWLLEGAQIKIHCEEPDIVMQRIGERWRKRQDYFTEDASAGIFKTNTARWVMLIPILLIDVIFSLISQFSLADVGLENWTPFTAFVGLLISAGASLMIYYRMLTTEFLN